jgi:hypothetical protein
MTAHMPSRALGVATRSSPSCSAEETKGEVSMINPETPTGRLLRKAANLLNSVAEAAWTNDIQTPAKWDLHRIGAGPTELLLGNDIAAALEQAAHTLAAIP